MKPLFIGILKKASLGSPLKSGTSFVYPSGISWTLSFKSFQPPMASKSKIVDPCHDFQSYFLVSELLAVGEVGATPRRKDCRHPNQNWMTVFKVAKSWKKTLIACGSPPRQQLLKRSKYDGPRLLPTIKLLSYSQFCFSLTRSANSQRSG